MITEEQYFERVALIRLRTLLSGYGDWSIERLDWFEWIDILRDCVTELIAYRALNSVIDAQARVIRPLEA